MQQCTRPSPHASGKAPWRLCATLLIQLSQHPVLTCFIPLQKHAGERCVTVVINMHAQHVTLHATCLQRCLAGCRHRATHKESRYKAQQTLLFLGGVQVTCEHVIITCNPCQGLMLSALWGALSLCYASDMQHRDQYILLLPTHHLQTFPTVRKSTYATPKKMRQHAMWAVQATDATHGAVLLACLHLHNRVVMQACMCSCVPLSKVPAHLLSSFASSAQVDALR